MHLAWLIFFLPGLAGLISVCYPKRLFILSTAVTGVVSLLLCGRFGFTAPPAFTWLDLDGLQVTCQLRGDAGSWDRALLLVCGAVCFLVRRERRAEMRKQDYLVWALLLASGLAAVLLEPGLFWLGQVSLLVGWVAASVRLESGLVHRLFNQLSLAQLFLLIGLTFSAAGYPSSDWLWLMVLGAGGWLGLIPWQGLWRTGDDRVGLGLYVGVGWPVGFSILFDFAPQIQADPLADELLYILGGLTALLHFIGPFAYTGKRLTEKTLIGFAGMQAGVVSLALANSGLESTRLAGYILIIELLAWNLLATLQDVQRDNLPPEKTSVLSRLFQGEVPRSGLSWWDGWLIDGLVVRGSFMQFLIVGELARLWQCGSVMVYLFLSLGGGALLYFGLLLPR